MTESEKMLDDVVKEYAAYFKLDLANEFQTVQQVIDNMITRLEELTSVVKIIKTKNNDCDKSISSDIIKYRSEINMLSKRIATLNEVILLLHNNVDVLEKQVEKAESDFGVSNDNKLKSLLKPFLKKTLPLTTDISPWEKTNMTSVLDNFEGNDD